MRALCDSDALFQRLHLKFHHFTLHTAYFTLPTSHLHLTLHLISAFLCSSAHRKAFTVREKFLTHKSRCGQKAFAQRSFCTQKLATQMHLPRKAFSNIKILHMRNFYAQHAFTQIMFYAEKLLPTEAFTHKLLHRDAFTHSKLEHTASFYTQEAFTHSKLLHTENFYTQSAFTPGKRLCATISYIEIFHKASF